MSDNYHDYVRRMAQVRAAREENRPLHHQLVELLRFVLDSYAQLFEATRRDFKPLYELTQRQPEIAPDQIVAGDKVISLGDGSWKLRRAQAA